MRELLRRIGFHLRRAQYESDLEEEMAHHLAMLQQDRGAAAAARKQFGNVTSFREESRNMWTFAWLEHLAQDLRYALRAMAANPLFTATAALSLALGVGANTAIYSFMNAILMRELPVQRPEQLVVLGWHAPKRPEVVQGINGTAHRYLTAGIESPNFPYAVFEKFKTGNPVLSSLFGYQYVRSFNVIAADQAETVSGGFVSGEYFSGLRVPPASGRLISPDDDRAGAPSIAILTYPFWQRRYNGDPSAVGQSIRINGVPFTIAGVTAPGFFGVDPNGNPMVFLPMHAMQTISTTPARDAKRFVDTSLYWIEMMGRLRPGVSLQQAEAALRTQFSAFVLSTAATPKDAEPMPQLYLDSAATGLDTLRRRYSKPIYVLMTMVGLILAIACANLANLLLARASARRREMAVRLSLGAGRWRLIRQMLTESIVLSVTGGALGLLVALAGIRMITWLLSAGVPDFSLRAELDWPVLGFTLALSILAGIIFGLAPAWQATKLDYTPALKENRMQGPAASGHRFRPRLGHALIVAQIGVSMLLVVAAGLFVRTLVNLHSIDVGFNRENILLVNLNGRTAGYEGAALARFYAGLLDRFRQIPGVRSASASNFPLVSQYVNESGVYFPGRAHQRGDGAESLNIDAGFLKTMQIPLVAGRDFEPGDLASPDVAIVNQSFANKYFPGENAIGHQFQVDPKQPLLQIVGIARDVNYNSFTEKREPLVYLTYTQPLSDLYGLFFELRTAGDPAGVASQVRRIVRGANREVPITEITTQQARMDGTIWQQRIFANLGAGFAGLALAIACVGLYGAMAYAVARRTGEIGIRMALGAQRGKIIWMVLREALILTGAGLLLGYGAARYSTRIVESFLYGIKADDRGAIAIAAGVLLLAGLTASYLPAWRASRIDPARALRNE